MPDYARENSQNAFAAFMSLGADKVLSYNSQERQNSKIASYSEDSNMFEKMASATIPLYNPTADSVEDFVRNHIRGTNKSVFGFTNDKIEYEPDVKVSFTPEAYEGEHSEIVTEGSGIATIVVGQFNIELPFLVHDKGFAPFDVIQMGGERMPFSTENLYKLILACVKKQKELEQEAREGSIGAMGSPFVSTEKKLNPTTSLGFLGTTLNVVTRNQAFPQNPNSMLVQAAQKMRDGIVKIAQMKEFDFGAIQEVFEKEAQKNNAIDFSSIEKYATDLDSEKKVSKTLDKFFGIKWIDVHDVKSGGYIRIPEMKNGNEISIVNAIVIRDFAKLNPKLPFERTALDKGLTMVLTQDGRIRVFTKDSHMLCLPLNVAPGKFASTTIEALATPLVEGLAHAEYDSEHREKANFIAFYDGKMTQPLTVRYGSARRIKASGNERTGAIDVVKFDIGACPLADQAYFEKNKVKDYFGGNLPKWDIWETKLNLFFIDDIPALTHVERNELVNMLQKQYMITELEARRIVGDGYDNYFVSPSNLKVLKINGTLDTFFKDRKELEFVMKNQQTVENELLFLKTALENEYIEIECRDKNLGKYNLKLSYTDKTQKMFRSREKSFTGVPIQNIRGILFSIGFSQNRVQELCYLAKKDGSVRAELPNNFDAEKITGAKSKAQALVAFNKYKNKVLGNDFVSKAAQTAIATALTDTPIAKNQGVRNVVLGQTQKHASDCETLSIKFEKLAKAKSSQVLSDTAAAMTLSHHLFSKVAEIIDEKKEYPQIFGVCELIKEASEGMGELAGILLALREAEIKEDIYDIEPELFQKAAQEMDSMHQLALGLLEKSAEAAAEEEDSTPLVQRIVSGQNKDSEAQKAEQADQAEKAKANEKEKTPGGKATPSKLVRRKNQHRYLK